MLEEFRAPGMAGTAWEKGITANEIAANLAPGAFIVLSGLQANQERLVLGKYRAFGLCLWRRFVLDEWSTLIISRPRNRERLQG